MKERWTVKTVPYGGDVSEVSIGQCNSCLWMSGKHVRPKDANTAVRDHWFAKHYRQRFWEKYAWWIALRRLGHRLGQL